MSAKVSVIIPVYNAEKYLKQCVYSVRKQTYTNLEILLIDDGSKDGSAKLCDDLQKEDKRIQVIHKNNEGAGKSRNCGIEKSTGEYIFFLDSDDYIKNTLIETCVTACQGSQAALVMFGVYHIDESMNIFDQAIPFSDKTVFLDDEVTLDFLPEMLYSENKSIRNLEMPACMANFYSANIIKKFNWHFESEKEYISEDLYSLLKLYKYVERLVVINDALYYYRHGHESLSFSSRILHYNLIKKFYFQCKAVCKDCNYSDKVLKNLKGPYLSLTITCLKLWAKRNNRVKNKNAEIMKILKDDLLRNVLKSHDLQYENLGKKILYKLIIYKHFSLAAIMIFIQSNILRKNK